MNRDDILDILSVVAAATHRTIGETDVKIWQGVIGDDDKQLALQAVGAHLKECPGVWMEPGHVHQRVRAYVRDQLDREPESARDARQEALAAKAAEDFELLAERKGIPASVPVIVERPALNPLLVRCPWCHVGVGQRCQVPGTTNILSPQLHMSTAGAHPARVDAVRNAEKGATA